MVVSPMSAVRQYRYLRVMADYTSSGIWGGTEVPGPRERHVMVEYDDLRLPSELVERFEAWQASYASGETTEEFDDIGRQLARALKFTVGAGVAVYYGVPANDEEVTDDTG
jgi:hypothetical protein